jgi:lipid-binding SYLF domain-containing protein
MEPIERNNQESSADTDLKLHAEILSYSRSRGVFAGVSLDGATLRPDGDANADLYSKHVTNEAIVTGKTKGPRGGSSLSAELNRYSARKESRKESGPGAGR